jgi:hypothetical protein
MIDTLYAKEGHISRDSNFSVRIRANAVGGNKSKMKDDEL